MSEQRLIDVNSIDIEMLADSLSTIAITGLSEGDAEEVVKRHLDNIPTAYDIDTIDRAILLLEKTVELFEKQDETPFVINLLTELVHYDDVECDGYCLKEDIEDLLFELKGGEQ